MSSKLTISIWRYLNSQLPLSAKKSILSGIYDYLIDSGKLELSERVQTVAKYVKEFGEVQKKCSGTLYGLCKTKTNEWRITIHFYDAFDKGVEKPSPFSYLFLGQKFSGYVPTGEIAQDNGLTGIALKASELEFGSWTMFEKPVTAEKQQDVYERLLSTVEKETL